MSARDEMMKTLVDFTSFPGGVADEVLQTLASAGYRILGPDDVDPVTLEKCAAEVKLLRQLLHSQTITLDVGREDMAYFLAEDAIRAIGRKA